MAMIGSANKTEAETPSCWVLGAASLKIQDWVRIASQKIVTRAKKIYNHFSAGKQRSNKTLIKRGNMKCT